MVGRLAGTDYHRRYTSNYTLGDTDVCISNMKPPLPAHFFVFALSCARGTGSASSTPRPAGQRNQAMKMFPQRGLNGDWADRCCLAAQH
jgi:hypothetical protein